MAVIFNIEEAVNNSAFNVLQEPLKMIMDKTAEAYEKKSIINKVFVMKTTDKYREEFRSITTMDNFKPTEDMEVAGLSSFEESYSKQFVFQIWTNSFVISKQTMEDSMYNVAESQAMSFVKSYDRTRELYAVRMLSAALGNTYADYKITAQSGLGMDTTTGDLDGTKRQYFHNQHKGVKIDGVSRVTQSNKFYADINFDGTDPELEEKIIDVIGQVENKMSRYMDDKGNIFPSEPTRIVVGEDYRLVDTLIRALSNKYGTRTQSNGNDMTFGKYELVISPYLSGVTGFEDTDHAMLLIDPERNREALGAVWFDRIPLTVRSYIDKDTEANIWAGRGRYGAGFGDFRAMSYISFKDSVANATEITPLATSVKNVRVVNEESNPVNTKAVS